MQLLVQLKARAENALQCEDPVIVVDRRAADRTDVVEVDLGKTGAGTYVRRKRTIDVEVIDDVAEKAPALNLTGPSGTKGGIDVVATQPELGL